MSIDKIVSIAGSAAAPVSQPAARARPDSATAPVKAVEAVEAVEVHNPQLEQIAQRLQSYMESVSRSLEFRVDAASGRTVVSVRDAATGDLIRQIPNEEVLRLAQMAEDQTLVLVDAKV